MYKHGKSIMRGNSYEKTLKKAKDSLVQYDKITKQLEAFEISKQTKENIKLFCTNAILLKVESLKKEDQKEYIAQIKKRKMIRNIKIRNLKQLVKKIVLFINIKLYLKMR